TSLAEVSLQDKILIQSALNSPRSPNASFSQTRQNVPSEKSVSRGPYTKTTISRRPFLFEGSLLDRILNGDVARSSNEDKPVHSKVTNNNNADNSDLVEPTEPDLGTFRIVCADVAHGEVPKRNLLERCATLQMSTWDEIVGEDSDDNDMTGSLEKSCKNIARSVLRQAFRQWLSCCRKLRVLRSRLACAVTPRLLTVDSPTDVSSGVDQQSWEQLRDSTDTEFTYSELCRRVYFGNCEPSLRKKVWPFLLGVYPWNANPEEVDRLEQLNERTYQTSLSEWLNAQYWVKDPDRMDSTPHLTANKNPNSRIDRLPNGPSQTSDPLRTRREEFYPRVNGGTDLPSPHHQQSASPLGLVQDDVAYTDSSSSSGQQSPAVETTSTLHTPTVISDASSADCAKRFEFDSLFDSRNAIEHIPSQLEFSSDSGTSVDIQSDGPVNFEISEEAPYSEEVLDALGINLYRIDKDVSRCDRNHSFFANPKKNLAPDNLKEIHSESDFAELNDNLNKLRKVICTWVWVHLDAGYIQGMCDLLAPLLVVLEDESVTYACFCRLMEWMLPNFPVAKSPSTPSPTSNPLTETSSTGLGAETTKPSTKAAVRPTLLSLAKRLTDVSSPVSPTPSNDSANLIDEGCSDVDRSSSTRNLLAQNIYVPSVPSPYSAALDSPGVNCMDLRFANLKALIEVFDPELFTFLTEKSLDCQFYFCYRWLLLDFKREFKYEDVFAIWEVIWASRRLVAYDFGVFFALAFLQYYRDIILYYDMDLTEIIRFYNGKFPFPFSFFA
ncbi:Small G protein signaling modulator 1, partial [Fasciolopsis buskii]